MREGILRAHAVFFLLFRQNRSLLVFILYSISINLTDSLPCVILVPSKAIELYSFASQNARVAAPAVPVHG